MAGTQREISSDFGTHVISFHGARRTADSDIAVRPTERLVELLKVQTSGKLQPRLERFILENWAEASGVMFTYRKFPLFSIEKTLLCDGSENGNLSKCTEIPGAGFFENGILTK